MPDIRLNHPHGKAFGVDYISGYVYRLHKMVLSGSLFPR